MAAVREGHPIDTTMGFTPTAGLVMSTRSGDLDPGLVEYFARTERMTGAKFNEMINKKSGLLGISETSSDVRDLLKCQKNDPRAAEALAIFCYQARKWIGAFTAALGGLDTLVFSGGIGENSIPIRARISFEVEHRSSSSSLIGSLDVGQSPRRPTWLAGAHNERIVLR